MVGARHRRLAPPGFLIVGRGWLGLLLVVGSVVMLTLLLAPDAYVAIGLAFAGVGLATATRALASRSRAAGASAG